jgi:hypothetical protein
MMLSEEIRGGLFLLVDWGDGCQLDKLINRIERLEKFRCGFCSYTAGSGHTRLCTQYRRAIDNGLQTEAGAE